MQHDLTSDWSSHKIATSTTSVPSNCVQYILNKQLLALVQPLVNICYMLLEKETDLIYFKTNKIACVKLSQNVFLREILEETRNMPLKKNRQTQKCPHELLLESFLFKGCPYLFVTSGIQNNKICVAWYITET